jgi:putative hydrolase of the HAD superfamily
VSGSPPRFIYFDLGNVLLAFSHARMCQQMADALGCETEALRSYLFDQPEARLIAQETGLVTSDEFHAELCERFSSNVSQADLAVACGDIFTLVPAIIPIVARLAEANHRLGILSNTSDWHWQWIRNKPYAFVSDLFDTYALSFEMHAMKPSVEAYHKAAEIAGVSPEEIFYIDDIEANVHGAQAAGFDAVLFTTPRQLVTDLQSRNVGWNY